MNYVSSAFVRRCTPFTSYRLVLARQLRSPRPSSQWRTFTSGTKWVGAQYTQFGQPRRHWQNSSKQSSTGLRVKLLTGGAVLAAIYYVSHLERTPESGRLRFMDVTSTMEEQYAKQATEEFLSQYASQILPPHHPLTLYVTSVVTSLLEASDLGHIARASDIPDGEFLPDDPGKKWNVIVIDDPKTVNAMATWGNVVVFTGILPICATPSGLAGVVGHEIAHVTLRHASETLSLMKAFNVLQIIFDLMGFDFVISRLFTTLVLELPNSRRKETEADALGMKYAAKACFDPSEIPGVYARLQGIEQKNGILDLAFLRTHPTGTSRTEALNKLLPEASAIRDSNEKCAEVAQSFSAFQGSYPTNFSIWNRRWSEYPPALS